MKTIELRTNSSGGLAKVAAQAALILWHSRQFSTVDIADLLTVKESEVAKLIDTAKRRLSRASAS